jgi:hypothetical protein
MSSIEKFLSILLPIILLGILLWFPVFACALALRLGPDLGRTVQQGNTVDVDILSGIYLFSQNTDTTAVVMFALAVIVVAALLFRGGSK